MNKKVINARSNEKFPLDWETINLDEDDYIKIVMGQSPPSSTYNSFGNGLPFLQGKAEFGEMYPNPILYCSKPIKIVEKDSILLSVRAPVGDVNIAPFKVCIGRGLIAIVVEKEKLNNFFLFYYLSFIKKSIDYLSSGSTFKAITKNDLAKIEIPIPNFAEQKKIVEILSAVDQAIEEVNEAITKTKRLKKGLMQKLLTKGIGHKEFKETEIGKIPKDWEIKKIVNLFIIETGTTPSTKQKEYWQNGHINWATPTDMSKLRGKLFIENSERKITEKGLKETNLTLMPNGSIILSTRAPVGHVVIVKGKTTSNQGCKGLIPKNIKKINTIFYAYYLLSKNYLLKNSSSGSTFKELPKKILENFIVLLPTIQEQNKIAEILSTVDQRIQSLKEKKNKLKRVKKGLMNDLLTGRKRVKVEA
mgnify:CR=1 FL=1